MKVASDNGSKPERSVESTDWEVDRFLRWQVWKEID